MEEKLIKYDTTVENWEQDYNAIIKYAQTIKKWVKKGPILDIACGDGIVGGYFYKKGFHVIGIELSGNRVKRAVRRIPVIKGDIRYLPFRNEVFNTVFLLAILAHGNEEFQEKIINESHRVLRKSGILIILTVNRWTLNFLRRIMTVTAYHDHVRELSPSQLKKLLIPRFKLLTWENYLILFEGYINFLEKTIKVRIKKFLKRIPLLGIEYFVVSVKK